MTPNPTITVEEALAELRVMFPDAYISVKRQEYTSTATYPTATPVRASAEIYINQGMSPPSCEAKTLGECMAQVRTWKQEQRG
jgi:hypothetical protein